MIWTGWRSVVILLCSLWMREIEGNEEFIQKAIEAHNKLRALHGSQPLNWDFQLEKSAQDVADKLVKTRQLTSSGLPDVGENVAGYKPKRGDDSKIIKLSKADIAFNSIMDWYGEIENFQWENYEANWFQGVSHATQILWNSTTKFGMAMATEPLPSNSSETEEGSSIIVAHYKVPGNVPGKFKENVLPRISDLNPAEKNMIEEDGSDGDDDERESISATLSRERKRNYGDKELK